MSSTVVLVGDDERRTANLANIFVKLIPVDDRKASQFEIMNAIRQDVLPKFTGEQLRVSVSPVGAISGGGLQNKEVAYYVSGPDLKKLAEYSQRLTAALARTEGVVDIDTSLVLGKPEMSVHLDRAKAAELGIQVADVATTLEMMVGGKKISNCNEGGEQYEVHARALPSWRTDADGLRQIAVPSARLGAVSLDNVAHFSETAGPSQVDRFGRRRQVTVTANMLPGHAQGTALEAIQKEVRALNLDPAYSHGTLGTSKEMGQAATNFLLAFLLSIVFMYLILAAQFESWLHPVAILLALPLTVPFALLAIIMFGQSLNIYTALGLLVLFGVVKKNAILQIDHTNALRAQGVPHLDAIMQANRDRLRPILMTTLAFVAGMVPMLVASGVGSGDNRAIGAVIFGGQFLSLLPVRRSPRRALAARVARSRHSTLPPRAHPGARGILGVQKYPGSPGMRIRRLPSCMITRGRMVGTSRSLSVSSASFAEPASTSVRFWTVGLRSEISPRLNASIAPRGESQRMSMTSRGSATGVWPSGIGAAKKRVS